MKFRRLTLDEIDCRVKTINKDGCSILLYKDARVDQNILDETVGCMNWQKFYSRDNANCTVSIWDDDKKQWVAKEDTGTESQTEAEKGLASDSFKRACFNWGIGRELYTAPYIFIECPTTKNDKGKYETKCKFKVTDIDYDSKGNIIALTIYNNYGKECWKMGKTSEPKAEPKAEPKEEPKTIVLVGKAHIVTIRSQLKAKKLNESDILAHYGLNAIEEMSMVQFTDCINNLRKYKDAI